mgnify:CR=1 FL=1
MKKRFSMRNRLLIIFGLLVAFATIIEGLLAIRTARKAVIEKIETHLTDKATDTAAVIDGKVAFSGGMNLADEYINQKILRGNFTFYRQTRYSRSNYL